MLKKDVSIPEPLYSIGDVLQDRVVIQLDFMQAINNWIYLLDTSRGKVWSSDPLCYISDE